MGRKLNLDHLSEEECERILKVIQRDFDVRQKEQKRLSQLEEEIREEDTKAKLVAKNQEFNENHCMRCFSRFFLIFNAKVQCFNCKYFTCKSCSDWDKNEKQYVCKVCQKQRELQKESNEWFYNNVRDKFKRFGSAKVVRSLYKRKTDSDSESEVWSSIPQHNSAPGSGKRTRPSLSAAFSMDVDNAPQNGIEQAVEEDIVATTRADTNRYNNAYTCQVATGRESFEDVKESELRRFRDRLEVIKEEIDRTLENQTPSGTPNSDSSTQEQYEKMLDNHKLHVKDALLDMSQSLHIAIDNQNVNDPIQSPNVTNATAKHQKVQEVLILEVECFTGQFAPAPPSNVIPGQPTLEDLLAEAVIKKIVADYVAEQEQKYKQEEDDLHRQLTKLSNKAHVTQLNDMVSESETDGEAMSPRNESDMESHSELSELSIVTKPMEVDSSAPLSPLTPISDSQKSVDSGIKVYSQSISVSSDRENNNNSSEDNKTEDQFWETVEGGRDETEDIESAWKTVEAKRSQFDSEASDSATIKPSIDDTLTTSVLETEVEVFHEEKPNVIEKLETYTPDENANKYAVSKRPAGEQRVEEVLVETKQALENAQPPPQVKDAGEEILAPPSAYDSEESEKVADVEVEKTSETFEPSEEEPEDIDNNWEFLNQRRAPLPSFGDEINREEVDLDDISRRDTESDTDREEAAGTLDSEILFGGFLNNSLMRRSEISAYDNYGDKKVGRDGEAPVFMFVPKRAPEEAIKVGDLNVDELSDLSENEASSDVTLSSDESTESEHERGYLDEEGHFVVGKRPKAPKRKSKAGKVQPQVSDLGVSTDDLEAFIRSQQQAEEEQARKKKEEEEAIVAQEEAAALEAAKLDEDRLNQLALSEIPDDESDEESNDADPRFVQRPAKYVTVEEGEPVQFDCQVDGTKPIDVFWYKDMVDIVDLAEDDRCEMSQPEAGKHTLTMFATSTADIGPYLCIAINDQGQCSKHFKLMVKENTGEKAAPEFLKKLSDVEVTEGDSVKLKVKVKGYPQPRILWYKDGKKIISDEQYRLEKLGNRDYLLAMDYVTLNDDAEFTVVAKNLVGEAKTSCNIIVETKPEEVNTSRTRLSSSFETVSPVASPTPSSSSQYDHLYPDTNQLLKLAKNVQSTRADVTREADDLLASADKMTSLHKQLDAMDQRLDTMEGDVNEGWTDRKSQQQIVQEHRDMERGITIYGEQTKSRVLGEKSGKTSAANIREVTSAALDILAKESYPTANSEPVPPPRTHKSEIVTPKPQQHQVDLDEEMELHLSYAEYEKVYNAGIVSRQQLRGGKCTRQDFIKIRDYLHSSMSGSEKEEFDIKHDLTIDGDFPSFIDCGLKRVDSKRYKRDYDIKRDGAKVQKKKWEVQIPSPLATQAEVVPSTPAGKRENPLEEIALNESEDQEIIDIFQSENNSTMNERRLQPQTDNDEDHADAAEEQIYLTSSKVFGLEQQVSQLEKQLEAVDEDSDPVHLLDLEDQVAQSVAMANTTEEELTGIEGLVRSMRQQYDKPNTSQSAPAPWKTQRSTSRSNSFKQFEERASRSNSFRQEQERSFSPVEPSRTSSVFSPLVQSQSVVKSYSKIELKEPDRSRSYNNEDEEDSDNSEPPQLPTSPPPSMPPPYARSSSPSPSSPPRAPPRRSESVPQRAESFSQPSVARQIRTQSAAVQRSQSFNQETLKGEQREDAIPSSSVEADVSIPSVKSLLTKFKDLQQEDPNTPGMKRVYSLTGRDIPQSVRDLRKKHGYGITSTVRVTSPESFNKINEEKSQFPRSSTPSNEPRQRTSSVDSPVHGDSEFSPIAKKSFALSPASAEKDSKSNSSNIKANHSSISSQSDSVESPVKKYASSSVTSSQSSRNFGSSKSPSVENSPKGKSAILARAAFWDTKITQGDEAGPLEFPDLPEESFKSYQPPNPWD